MLAPWKKSYDQNRQHIKKQRHFNIYFSTFNGTLVLLKYILKSFFFSTSTSPLTCYGFFTCYFNLNNVKIKKKILLLEKKKKNYSMVLVLCGQVDYKVLKLIPVPHANEAHVLDSNVSSQANGSSWHDSRTALVINSLPTSQGLFTLCTS